MPYVRLVAGWMVLRFCLCVCVVFGCGVWRLRLCLVRGGFVLCGLMLLVLSGIA